MSSSDIIKWNKKHRSSTTLVGLEPDEELIRYSGLLPKAGRVLDLACGSGKNALFLAQQGLDVVALDGSIEGLNLLRKAAAGHGLSTNIQCVEADLDEFVLPQSQFDLIVVARYLNQALFAAIQAALKPGGILFYKTFNRNILQSRPGFSVSFTIEREALRAGFSRLTPLVDQSDDAQYSLLIAKNS